MSSIGTRRMLSLVLALFLWANGGCKRTPSYIPSTDSARQALESALNAWQKGQSVGRIEGASPPVQAVDSGWGKGLKLASYEILEEVSRADGRRSFKVRLRFQKPPATQEVHYLIVGKSPLWVFREEDYNSFQDWGGGSGQKR